MAAAESAVAQYDGIDFSRLVALDPDEVVTHSYVRDLVLPSGKRLALITLDNGRDHTRPNTLGPASLTELKDVLDQLKARAAAKEIDAVAITGKQFIMAAGADLSRAGDLPSRDVGLLMAQLGHATLGRLGELGVPSFAYTNGLALGGGVEIGLNSTYRTIDATVPAFALPEVFLGIIPGWGGAYLMPNLVGIENALEVVVSNPLKTNTMLNGKKAFDLGIADAIFPSVNFLEDSLRWTDGVLTGAIKVKRANEPGRLERAVKWDVAIGIADKTIASRLGRGGARPGKARERRRSARSG